MIDYRNLAVKFFVSTVLCFYVFLVGAHSDSLWSANSNSPYTTPKAAKPGDVITIIIEERTSALQSGTTQSDKDTDIQFDIANAFSSSQAGKSTGGESDTGFLVRGANRYRGVGRTMSNSTFKTVVTATVIDVQPNGNLFVMGQRQLVLNNETQQLEVSGIVRASDISPLNTIRSSQLANTKISLSGSGPVSAPQNTGLFSKLFGWLF